MNPYYYLFYKLTQFLNKKGNNEWGPIGAITLLVELNIGVLYVKYFSVDRNNFNEHKVTLIIIFAFIFILNTILFLNKKRTKKINEHYQNESKRRRNTGSFLVILYVIFSLGVIVFK